MSGKTAKLLEQYLYSNIESQKHSRILVPQPSNKSMEKYLAINYNKIRLSLEYKRRVSKV